MIGGGNSAEMIEQEDEREMVVLFAGFRAIYELPNRTSGSIKIKKSL